MKKNKLFLFTLISSVTLFISGCGKNYAGTYTGTQNSTSSGLVTTGGAASSSVTITLSQNGDSITGTWQETSGALTLTGSIPSGGTITVTATGTLTNNSSTTTTSYYYSGTSGVSYTCSYSGTLTLNNNTITGTLTSTTSSGSTGYYYCATSKTVTATKSN